MICEGACAHVRCAVARLCVRAKFILESVRDVRACGSFSGVRCAITILHTFWNKMKRKWHFFCFKNYFRTFFPVLEHPFLLWNILFWFGTSFSALEHPFLLWNILFCFRMSYFVIKQLIKC